MTPSVAVTEATTADLAELVELAAATFPLACPVSVRPQDIAAFIATNLSCQRFAEYLADPDRSVFVARGDDRLLGYAITALGISDDPEVANAVIARPAVELSKLYVLPGSHGTGVATALMQSAALHAAERGRCLWLGVNQKNLRAQRFYGKHGFTVVGTRTFSLGAHTENDFVMLRAL